jgi:hypothetical protein
MLARRVCKRVRLRFCGNPKPPGQADGSLIARLAASKNRIHGTLCVE